MTDVLEAWGIHADIVQADTHVRWAATSAAEWRVGGLKRTLLFDRSICSREMLGDLINRGVVTRVTKSPPADGDFHQERVWEQLQELADDPCSPQEAKTYRLTVQAVGKAAVRFDLQLWGYKYSWGSVELPEPCFYELAGRLDANIRFQSEWSPVHEPATRLGFALENSPSLQLIRGRLEPFLERLPRDYATDMEALAGDSLLHFEKLLRKVRQRVGWSREYGSAGGLEPLIKQLKSSIHLPQDQENLLWIIAKPYRDYVLHGNDLPPIVARPVLGTSLELLRLLADTLDTELGDQLQS